MGSLRRRQRTPPALLQTPPRPSQAALDLTSPQRPASRTRSSKLRSHMAKPLLCITLAVSFLACNAEQGYAQLTAAQEPAVSTTAALTPSQLESAGYRVIAVAVDDPFTFLPFINSRRNALVSRLTALLVNQ